MLLLIENHQRITPRLNLNGQPHADRVFDERESAPIARII
jgi:hypothetical protein